MLEYLTEEVVRRQAEPVQRFLIQTAVLDRLCGSLCEALNGESDGDAVLGDPTRLLRFSLFLRMNWPRSASYRWQMAGWALNNIRKTALSRSRVGAWRTWGRHRPAKDRENLV